MGVFENALTAAAGLGASGSNGVVRSKRGMAARLLELLHRRTQAHSRLELIERINLAPHQTLALVEADGQRLLVATSQEGAPAFFPLKSAANRRASGGSHKMAAEGKQA